MKNEMNNNNALELHDEEENKPSEKLSHSLGDYSMEMMARICRSTGPKEVLIKLAVNRHLLLLQISAIKIQTLVRKFIAKTRYHRIQRHLKLFLTVTEEYSQRVLEEVVLSSSLEIVIRALKTAQDFQIVNSIIQGVFADVISEVLEEVREDLTYETVIDLLQSLSSSYLMLQKFGTRENYLRQQQLRLMEEQKQRNPLLNVIFTLTDDVTLEFIKPVVIEAIEEEVVRYLLDNYSQHLLDQLLHSPAFDTEVQQVLRNCLDELSLTSDVAAATVTSLDEKIKENKRLENQNDARLIAIYRQRFPPHPPTPEGEKEVAPSLSKEVASLFVKNLLSSLFPA
eukprot:gene16750-19095_t